MTKTAWRLGLRNVATSPCDFLWSTTAKTLSDLSVPACYCISMIICKAFLAQVSHTLVWCHSAVWFYSDCIWLIWQISRTHGPFANRQHFLSVHAAMINLLTLWSPTPQIITLCHTGLTYRFNFRHSSTLALSPERQSARMSEIKNGRLCLYGAEHSKCDHMMTLSFKGWFQYHFSLYTKCNVYSRL